MIKKYSVSVPLSGKVYSLAKRCQNMMYESMLIKSSWIYGAEPHINLISGTTKNIDDIISRIKKFKYKENKNCELIGLGVLMTPDPLVFMRFTNSLILKELRYFLFRETLPLWDSLTPTVMDNIWIPKSTLAFKDFALDNLCKALISVKDIKFQLIMEINELSIIEFTDKEYELKRISI